MRLISSLLCIGCIFLTGHVTAAPKTAPDSKTESAQATQLEVTTTKGRFLIELFSDKAPLTVKNFLGYVAKNHYDNTAFHRVIPGFVVQGGGYQLKSGKLTEKKPDPPVTNESRNGLSNKRGTIAMARTQDPDSASSQFFINLGDNLNLDGSKAKAGYTVFGRVTKGMAVVDKIAKAKTGKVTMHRFGPDGRLVPQEFLDNPQTPIMIKTIRIK